MRERKSRKLRMMSIGLLLTVLMGNVFGASGLEFRDEIDGSASGAIELGLKGPLEYMKDLPADPRRMSDGVWESGVESEESQYGEIMRRELEVREGSSKEPDDGSTDRYIVKYKTGQKEAFQSKLSWQVSHSEAISVSVDMALEKVYISASTSWHMFALQHY